MNTTIKLSALLLAFVSTAFVSAFSSSATVIPEGAYGVVTAETMTQGELLWLKGRVGDAAYIVRLEDGNTCTMTLPVAIGSIADDSDSSIGVETTKGFTIAIMTEKLSNALLQGERINSKDWQFDSTLHSSKTDGVVISGISGKEGFVLNSRRRWISWMTGENYPSDCL